MRTTTLPLEKRAGIAGRHIVSCGAPATMSHNALTTGNGTLLLSSMGDPQKETLLLRMETLIAPQWEKPPKAPLIADYLPRVRALIRQGRYKEAAEMADMAAAQRGCSAHMTHCPTHPAIRLSIEQDVCRADDYFFTLNMRNSLVTTRWCDGGLFTREAFASRADSLCAVRLRAPGGRLSFLVSAEFPELKYERGSWTGNDILGGGSGLFDCQAIAPETAVRHAAEGILLDGEYAYNRGSFSVAVRLATKGGSVCAEEGGVRVEGADEAVMLLDCRRNEPAGQVLARLREVSLSFDELLNRHMAIHQPMFDRLSVSLGGDEVDYLLTTVELKQKQFTDQRILPAYMEAMVDMGRFFLLNESGEFPPIYGHVNVNVNHQISGGNVGNLPEMMESFFHWIENQLPDARENAERILGARGFFIACHPDTEQGIQLHFSEYWPHHYWISSSGWCLQPFLEHYYCTGDDAFLRERLIPLYAELALLYEDFLTETDDEGQLMFIPSYSPENFPLNIPVMAVINATMDISVCREVLTTLLKYAPEAGYDDVQDYQRWETMLSKLPKYLMDAHGELKEWAWSEFEERHDHRHASQLYGAYPGDEFQPELDEALYRAAFICNRMRAYGNESCHGVMHRAQAAARLKDSWLVQSLLRFTLESGYVNDNFTTAHNPYVKHYFPDGQGALPTVLLESLLYSRPGFIEPLPALPEGSFRKGALMGMAARSFAKVDLLEWNLEEGFVHLTLTPLKDQRVTFCMRRPFDSVTIDGEAVPCAPHIDWTVRKDRPITVEWRGAR